MILKHSVIELQANSRYLGRQCPVTRKKLGLGDQIVVCHKNNEVISWTGWPALEGRCPYCDEVVTLWSETEYKPFQSDQEKKSHPKLKTDYHIARRDTKLSPARILLLVILTLGLIGICGVGVNIGYHQLFAEPEVTPIFVDLAATVPTVSQATKTLAVLPPTAMPSTATRPPNPTATLHPIRTSAPTRRPTNTPPPSPTVTHIPIVTYRTVSLGETADAYLDFSSPPWGSITLAEVPFQLSDKIFKSQASPSPDNTYPTKILLSMDVPRAYQVHLLLNTGNGFNQFNGRVIGQVVAYCNGTAIPIADLQLGRDVREWHMADNVVSTASNADQVWSGALADFPNLTGHIDMLTLDLPNACQSGRLTALEIVDSSTDTVNSLDPALNLVGVTVEHYQ